MDFRTLEVVIDLLAWIMILLVIVSTLLSYVLSPYHPVREALDRLLEPLLTPIRSVLPQTGMIDFSPMVLILIIQLVRSLLVTLIP